MFSRICLDKLQNKIDYSNILKDGKILEAVHGRFEHHHCSKLCACWQFDLQWCEAESHAAWGISKWWRHLVCVLQRNNRYITPTFILYNDVHAVNF